MLRLNAVPSTVASSPAQKSFPPPTLDQAVTEIRYQRGIVYLDRCGSLMLALQDELGEAFEGSVPTMDYGELTSKTERLTVRYGRSSVTVLQQFTDTPARVEQIAPRAWNIVAKSLGVERQVVRCGLRLLLTWPAPSVEVASAAIVRSGLIAPTPLWQECFGRTSAVDLTTTFEGRSTRSLRAQLSVVRQKVSGPISEELKAFLPATAIRLDLDYVYPSENPPFDQLATDLTPMAVGPGAMKDFLRASWEHSKVLAGRIRQAIGDLENA